MGRKKIVDNFNPAAFLYGAVEWVPDWTKPIKVKNQFRQLMGYLVMERNNLQLRQMYPLVRRVWALIPSCPEELVKSLCREPIKCMTELRCAPAGMPEVIAALQHLWRAREKDPHWNAQRAL